MLRLRANTIGDLGIERRLGLADMKMPLVEMRASGGGAGSLGASGGSSGGEDGGSLSDRDLKSIEREYPGGLTSVQIVHIFAERGIRFSEATFRKYVQLGLLPRSRRVGRKGKHQGSLGLYPATTVRRIDAVKRLMARNYTIEDIQRQFLRFRDDFEALERGVGALFSGFEEAIRAPHFDARGRRDLKRELAEARKVADELLRRIGQIERRVSEPHERSPGAGTPGGAEDLL